MFVECVYILFPLSGIWYSPLHYHLYSHLLGSTFCMRCVYLVSPSFRFDIRHHAPTHKCQERRPQRSGGIGGIWNYHELRKCSSFQTYKIQLNTFSPPKICCHFSGSIWTSFLSQFIACFYFWRFFLVAAFLRTRLKFGQEAPRSNKEEIGQRTAIIHNMYIMEIGIFWSFGKGSKNEFMTFAVT